MALEVLDPGPSTTVQDFGRPGHGAYGVAEGGAMDRELLAAVNRAAGNRPGAAALEFALKGPQLRWQGSGRLRLAIGADEIRQVTLGPGEKLDCGALRRRAYGYIAVAGSIEVPIVMGSRSTCLAGGFGGLQGRALQAGDSLTVAPAPKALAPPATFSRPYADGPVVLRVLRVSRGSAWRRLLAAEWRVATGNRVGLRLDGEPLHLAPLRLSQGVPPGALQVTGSGQPILLLRDHPTVGGYPALAVVVSADLDVASQVRLGALIEFREAIA
jgi:antagonist of KipI